MTYMEGINRFSSMYTTRSSAAAPIVDDDENVEQIDGVVAIDVFGTPCARAPRHKQGLNVHQVHLSISVDVAHRRVRRRSAILEHEARSEQPPVHKHVQLHLAAASGTASEISSRSSTCCSTAAGSARA